VTHERVSGNEGGRNLKVWDTSAASLVAAFSKKGINEGNWPALQFDAAETHLFFVAKDSIVLYDVAAGDFAKATRKVKLEGVIQLAVGPGRRKAIAAFAPESRSSKPAVAAVADWGEGGEITNRKQFFRVRSVGRYDLQAGREMMQPSHFGQAGNQPRTQTRALHPLRGGSHVCLVDRTATNLPALHLALRECRLKAAGQSRSNQPMHGIQMEP
jgi:hypothetical protein